VIRLQRNFSIFALVFCGCLLCDIPAKGALLLNTGVGNSTTSRVSDSGPGQGVATNANMTITQMAMDLNMPNGGDIKYMIWNAANTTLLFSQVLTLPASSTPAFVLSNPFSFNLSAGQTYYFGVIGDNNLNVSDFFPPQTLSQNGLTLVNPNSSYTSFGAPVFSSTGAASITLELFGTPLSTVPEPASLMLVTGALSILGLRFVRPSEPRA